MTDRKKFPLTPKSEVVVLKSSGRHIINSIDISSSLVGEKAYGLACLPKNWTPKWFLISSDCFLDYKSARTENDKAQMLEYWANACLEEIESSDFPKTKDVIVRSSGTNETLKDRGKFYSKTGQLDKFKETLKSCLDENMKDPDSDGQIINFIVQSYENPREKGHLSNERRCSKEQRDWLGEIEKSLYSEPFKVNYRPWRTRIETDIAVSDRINCNLSINIQKSLMSVAAWAQNIESRLHFEWVWNGQSIFLVQVEKETTTGSFNPTAFIKNGTSSSPKNLKTFREITDNDAQNYRKIKNVFIYRKLKLPIVPIYILDDQDVIKDLSEGIVSEGLRYDIENLTKSSLVIRTDIASSDQRILQMLPRSEELRSKNVAIDWLIKQSSAILNNLETRDQKIAFICHNFIPSESAAFAFASPGERKVQIEALWGIPEGLYYNSHDKYVVDTLDRKAGATNTPRSDYKIHKKVQFKNYCVAPDTGGEWKMQEIAPPHDWRSSIRKDEWLSYIAANSRRIAEQEQKAISVMWFVGLASEDEKPELIPWFHEECHAISPQKNNDFQKKTPHDKIFEIKFEKDINELKEQLKLGKTSITHIRVKPVEEHLLREKATLRRIGEIAKSANKVILLEGATLSHAYYQLVELGALVQATAWFDEDTEVREFHKLVRDKVPEKIANGGEKVDISTLRGDALNKALKEKLVEEAIEVLDAKNYDSLLEEIADVQEVIEAIIKQVGANADQVSGIQEKKRKKLGGFSKGLVLEGTSNPSVHSQTNQNLSLDLSLVALDGAGVKFQSRGAYRASTSWKDKRRTENTEEVLVNFVVPILENSWSVESQDLQHPDGQQGLSKAKLKGTRSSGKLRIELSLFTTGPQLDLFQ